MGSSEILTHRSWKLVSIEKVIVVAALIGLLATIFESNVGLGALSDNLDQLWTVEMNGFQPDVVKVIKLILWIAIVVKAVTKEVYIGCYVVMIYAFITGNKSIIYPWIVVSGIRSLLIEAVSCFTACIVCAHCTIVKYLCLDYVISKGISLACSVCLWTKVHDIYVTETVSRPSIRINGTTAPQVRSLDSMMAEAVMDWFTEEAERCRKFDSKLAVDEDILMFENGLSQRAAQFLELKPEDILEGVRIKLDRKLAVLQVQAETQTEQTDFDNEIGDEFTVDTHSRSNTSVNNQTMSEFDMEVKNPLRRFPYFPLNEDLECCRAPSIEYIEDTMLGKKCVSVQTLESYSDSDLNVEP